MKTVEEKALLSGFRGLANIELAQYVDEIPDWSYLADTDCNGDTFIDEIEYRAGLDREDYTDEVNGFDFEQLIEDGLKKLCKRGIVC